MRTFLLSLLFFSIGATSVGFAYYLGYSERHRLDEATAENIVKVFQLGIKQGYQVRVFEEMMENSGKMTPKIKKERET